MKALLASLSLVLATGAEALLAVLLNLAGARGHTDDYGNHLTVSAANPSLPEFLLAHTRQA